MHIAHVMRSSIFIDNIDLRNAILSMVYYTTWHVHACQISSAATLKKAKKLVHASVLWWVSCIVVAIANCTYSSRWKEAIAVCSVHQELVGKWGRQWQLANDARTLNEAFSVKATQQKPWKHHEEPYDTLFSVYKEVCSRFRGDRWNDYCNPTVWCMR